MLDFLIRYFARNLDQIINALQKLDKALDDYVAKTEAEAQDLRDQSDLLKLASQAKAIEADKAGRIRNNIRSNILG